MNIRKTLGLMIAAAATAALAPVVANAQEPANPSWAGFYAGVNLGGIWSNTSAAIGENNTGGGFSGMGGGFQGGIQGGYNWLLGPVMLGGEIDFQGSTLTSGLTGGAGPSAIGASYSMPWYSTFRARVGYPMGPFMPYVTGGAVWGQQNLSGTDSVGGSFSASNNFWTYTFGGGVEAQINNKWSAKLEYLRIGTPDTPLSTPATTSINENSTDNVVRVGLNYHFN
jgi:outer membrane immunogenic protein